eukprot:COSAG02_NODE_396_length_23126_cov_282.150258_11_plen_147_part_00
MNSDSAPLAVMRASIIETASASPRICWSSSGLSGSVAAKESTLTKIAGPRMPSGFGVFFSTALLCAAISPSASRPHVFTVYGDSERSSKLKHSSTSSALHARPRAAPRGAGAAGARVASTCTRGNRVALFGCMIVIPVLSTGYQYR